MNCPACDNALSTINVSGIDMEICSGGCGGIWFDQFEFRKFDEPHEYAGEEILSIQTDPGITVDHEKRRTCPKCEGMTMLRRFYSPKRRVEIDECPECAGIWLDYGELLEIRSLFSSEQERSEYSRKYLDREFSADLETYFEESARKTERLDRFANIFSFLYPSWWFPGKQD